jgi:hypothetical protein
LGFVVSHSSNKKTLDEWGTVYLCGTRGFILRGPAKLADDWQETKWKMVEPEGGWLGFVVSHSSSKKTLDEWGTVHLCGTRGFVLRGPAKLVNA